MHSSIKFGQFPHELRFIVLAVAAIAFSSMTAFADVPWIVRGKQGMVAADSKYASEAGLEILKEGGNAIDAAVATSFALAVTRPYSTGLGGGGFLVARMTSGQIVIQDFRETAPASADVGMFVRARTKDPIGPSPSEFGHLAVATPGLVAGRWQIASMFGVRPFEKLLQPAIRLASTGFAVDRDFVEQTAEVLKIYEKYPALKQSCPYVYHTLLRDGKPWTEGEILKQPALAHLLEELACSGPEFFYRGPVADAIEAEMQRNGGVLSSADLADYRARILKPIEFDYRDFHIITMSLPSSGGIALAESLGILGNFDIPNLMRTDPPLAAHYQIEALKHAFADRAQWLGDDSVANVPKTRLLSKSYADSLSRQVQADRTEKPKQYGSLGQPKDAGTSSFCVADKYGNVVVSTETINTEFGSLVAIDEWGLVLNNEMDDFAAEPDKPNAFGLIQSSANSVASNKRPLSSMTPTIVMKDDKPYMLIGASGGPRIISAVLNVMLGVLDGKKSLEEATIAPRPHHQWMPDKVYFDREPNADIVAGLKRRGHEISDDRKTAAVQAILKSKDGDWLGASDPHKGGIPAGY